MNDWKLLRRCGFLQTRSTYRNEARADYLILKSDAAM